jgi:hypothetical protein
VLVALLRVPAPVAGEMLQLTPLLPGSFLTVAVRGCVPPAGTPTGSGATTTVIDRTMMFAEADFDVSETDVAVMVTARSLAGGVAGAL